jgi:biopolymer transport protein ExbB/TolQ
MTWLLLLTKLKTFWSKGKYYISIALVGAAAIFIFFVLKKKDKAWEMVQKIKDNHNKELDIINNSHKEVSEKKRKEVDKYHKIIKEIEDKHKKQNDDLNTNYKKDVDRLMKKYEKDPQALAKRLSEEFGINHKE